MSLLGNIKVELFLLILVFTSIFIFSGLDISLHNLFSDLNINSSNQYLQEFFKDITELGNSSWYFGVSIFFFIIFYLLKKINIVSVKNLDKKKNFFLFSIIYLSVVGIITQILKHIIGRPRPNHTDFENFFDFNFFNLDSNFHSFPSGHSSTIFIVCLILCKVLPKIRLYFIFLAMIVAISRVVVGAHFFTDVVAGALLSLTVYKFLNALLNKNHNQYIFNEIKFKDHIYYNYSVLILLGFCLFLSFAPSLDLYIASLFYLGNLQFSLQSFDLVSILFRKILIPIILIYILALPIFSKLFGISKIFFGYNFLIKEILLIWFSQILSILIVVNLLLKNLWGRARPGDILEFGGQETFSPWYKISSSCDTNCSFVSGDSSVGFAIIILYFVTKNIFFLYASLVFGFVLGFIRILAGGHFLSDVVFSGLITIFLNFLIVKLYNKSNGQ